MRQKATQTTHHAVNIEDVAVIHVVFRVFGNVSKVREIFGVLT